MDYKVYQELASAFGAYINCRRPTYQEWKNKWKDKIDDIVNNCLPSGSGIDSGNKFDFVHSKRNRLVINSSYHRIDSNDSYAEWINYNVIIVPDFISGFVIDIQGPFGKHQDIKDYLADTYQWPLSESYKERKVS
jgi:hypothetical protein